MDREKYWDRKYVRWNLRLTDIGSRFPLQKHLFNLLCFRFICGIIPDRRAFQLNLPRKPIQQKGVRQSFSEKRTPLGYVLPKKKNLTQNLNKTKQHTNSKMCGQQTSLELNHDSVLFYGISTLVGYLMPNLRYTYTLNTYDLVLFCFMAYQPLWVI